MTLPMSGSYENSEGRHIIAIDPASKDGDWGCKVTFDVDEDGTMTLAEIVYWSPSLQRYVDNFLDAIRRSEQP